MGLLGGLLWLKGVPEEGSSESGAVRVGQGHRRGRVGRAAQGVPRALSCAQPLGWAQLELLGRSFNPAALPGRAKVSSAPCSLP